MKTVIRPLLLFVITLVLVGSCVCGDLEHTNINDPSNPNVVRTVILSAPADGAVIDSSTVTIVMEDNDNVARYHYRLDGGVELSITGTVITLANLDEGEHTVTIWMENSDGDLDDTPEQITFTVDAVDGPALMIRPRYAAVTAGDTFSVQVMLEELETADSLTGLNLLLLFDRDLLEIRSMATAAALPAGQFSDSTVTDSSAWLLYQNISASSLVTGSGALVNIGLTARQTGTAVLAFDPDDTKITTLDKTGMNPAEDKTVTLYSGNFLIQ